jgi:hypothetical protein
MTLSQQSRCDARARVRSWQVVVAVAHIDAADLLGTVFTKKINPRWASGGLPLKGDS